MNTRIPGANLDLLDDRLAANSPPVLMDARILQRQKSEQTILQTSDYDVGFGSVKNETPDSDASQVFAAHMYSSDNVTEMMKEEDLSELSDI